MERMPRVSPFKGNAVTVVEVRVSAMVYTLSK
jgi:hypothetical protein